MTLAILLMYHPESEIIMPLTRKHGRLLKLVDRADLGSVGASHESSSLSPPTVRKPTELFNDWFYSLESLWGVFISLLFEAKLTFGIIIIVVGS